MPNVSSCLGRIQPVWSILFSPPAAREPVRLDPARSTTVAGPGQAVPGPGARQWSGASPISPCYFFPDWKEKTISWYFPQFLTCIFMKVCHLSSGFTRCQYSNLVTDRFCCNFLEKNHFCAKPAHSDNNLITYQMSCHQHVFVLIEIPSLCISGHISWTSLHQSHISQLQASFLQ